MRILKNNTNWCITIIRTSNKGAFALNNNKLCWMDNFIGQSQNENSGIIISISISIRKCKQTYFLKILV